MGWTITSWPVSGAVHHVAATHVHAHVVDVGRCAEKDQVAGLQVSDGDPGRHVVLVLGRVGHIHAGFPPRHHHEARAVVRCRPGATPLVWLADLRFGKSQGRWPADGGEAGGRTR